MNNHLKTKVEEFEQKIKEHEHIHNPIEKKKSSSHHIGSSKYKEENIALHSEITELKQKIEQHEKAAQAAEEPEEPEPTVKDPSTIFDTIKETLTSLSTDEQAKVVIDLRARLKKEFPHHLIGHKAVPIRRHSTRHSMKYSKTDLETVPE